MRHSEYPSEEKQLYEKAWACKWAKKSQKCDTFKCVLTTGTNVRFFLQCWSVQILRLRRKTYFQCCGSKQLRIGGLMLTRRTNWIHNFQLITGIVNLLCFGESYKTEFFYKQGCRSHSFLTFPATGKLRLWLRFLLLL